ncbi:MAG: glgE [Actinobacteria bacterium]|nr:glgE [Actinomycetota bacterium]
MNLSDGRRRVVVEGVQPEIDCGRFAIKRITGDTVTVEADVFADGHDVVTGILGWRRHGAKQWTEMPMEDLGNDRWRASFVPEEIGNYEYSVRGWVDHFATWWRGMQKKREAGVDVKVDRLIGADLIEAAAKRAPGEDAERLLAQAEQLRGPGDLLGLSSEMVALVSAYADTTLAGSSQEYGMVVDRPRARFSAWYEMFPRSASDEPGRHGTLKDVERRLPYVAGLGFDVLYLPPIHPIGVAHRKGKNNSTEAGPEDPGSPWAIGGAEGGHTAIHPELGTIADFDRLVVAAGRFGLEIALDFAIQASPDHPWVTEHPQWFRARPDGTLQYAENPPKKYQDIYPLDFESEDWQNLWEALKEVVDYWIGHGVKIFRVDNPHTKTFAFWEWLIGGVKAEHPDVLFLAEAFTRPKVMYRLAKLGFTQSYTYFTWRTTKAELIEYVTELTTTEVREFFRPNFWPNTPDILAQQLQGGGGRAAFVARLILAACLSPSYGIYGPPFEMGEDAPITPGSEEYLNSEKYEIRSWDLHRMDSLSEVIARVNLARNDNPALQGDAIPAFQPVDNDQLIAWTKATDDLSNVILVVVNLDPHYAQSGWVDLPLAALGLPAYDPYQVEDLLTGTRFTWSGPRNYVRLDPAALPAHILALRPHDAPVSYGP